MPIDIASDMKRTKNAQVSVYTALSAEPSDQLRFLALSGEMLDFLPGEIDTAVSPFNFWS